MLFFFMLVLLVFGSVAQKLSPIYEWNLLRYKSPSRYWEDATHRYKPEKTIISSLEVGLHNIFLAIPKIWSDNPASLTFLPRDGQSRTMSPELQPYPNYDFHLGPVDMLLPEDVCSKMVNVFRIRADRCNRLWALDCGVVESNAEPKSICPPKLLAFNMTTNTLVREIEVPDSVLAGNSLLTNFAIDDTDEEGNYLFRNCDVGYIYITDIASPAIVTFSAKTGQFWRHSHPTMYPHPEHAKFTVAGESFTLMDGITGLALSNPGVANRQLFYHPMSSNSIFTVSTAALKARPTNERELPVVRLGEKSSQSIPLAFDPIESSLIFSPLTETALVAWKPGRIGYKVLALDPINLQGVTDIRPADRDYANLWIVSNKLHKFQLGTINPTEINIRIFRYIRGETQARPTFQNASSAQNRRFRLDHYDTEYS